MHDEEKLVSMSQNLTAFRLTIVSYVSLFDV